MKKLPILEESLLFVFFVSFGIISLLTMRYVNLEPGIKFASLTALFHIVLVILSKTFRWFTPFQIWKFLFPLSVFLVFPDWFLSDVLGVLVFPEDGFFKIGTVSGYMAGLWAIPLFILVYTGIKLEERSVSIIGTCLWVASLSLVVFGGAEATSWMLNSWYAQNVTKVSGMAIYVLIPEMILGVVTYLAYQGFSQSHFLIQMSIGFLIMIQYLGSLTFFYLLIERIL
ncbi:hypothetical protein EHQ58_11290 [Leptospira ognonensis]|uniref:DUF6989 domain-containing protein n=1 Tax=Leptospira ognonensis TaxID=2484945 RepID=A0A4R9JZZ7_9LEPT|nr:hypothetical protein [Leptospira ognonensis]TGL57978.1 hypothetical protein EHQ58_11290 [Leptospira ognonensis]